MKKCFFYVGIRLFLFTIVFGTTACGVSDETDKSSKSSEVNNCDVEESIRVEFEGWEICDKQEIRIGNFVFSIPDYWKEDRVVKKGDYEAHQLYAETGGKVAMLDIALSFDEVDKVTYDLLVNDNENMISVIENLFDGDANLFSEFTTDFGLAGLMYEYDGYIDFENERYNVDGLYSVLPSEKDNSWLFVVLSVTDNTQYLYNNDYLQIIENIKKEAPSKKNNVDVISDYVADDIIMTKDSTDYKRKNYLDVKKEFEDLGFNNIELKELTEEEYRFHNDGEVKAVKIRGWGFDAGKAYSPDTQVLIEYWGNDATKEDTSNLTINNCDELKYILSNKAEIDSSYSDFSVKYRGRTIEFDGRIDYVVNHENYDTRYDILVSAGDYNPNSMVGPYFKFENVAAYNLNLDTLFLENEIWVGRNVHIIAEVGKFDSNSGLFYLDPVSVKGR